MTDGQEKKFALESIERNSEPIARCVTIFFTLPSSGMQSPRLPA